MDQLPTVPPGENPWTVYLQFIGNLFYRESTPGFKGRLIAMMTLGAFGILLDMLYLFVQVWDARRHKLPSLWLFKMVSTSSGRYIVTNVRFLFSLLNCISDTILIGTAHAFYTVYIERGSQRHFIGWTFFQSFSLALSLWTWSCGLMQMHILINAKPPISWLPPIVANTVFIAGEIIFAGGLLILAIFGTVKSYTLVDTFNVLRNTMLKGQAEYKGGLDFGLLIGLAAPGMKLADVGTQVQKTSLVLLSWVTAAAFAISIISGASFFLSRSISKHVNERVDHLKRHISSPEENPLSSTPSTREVATTLSYARKSVIEDLIGESSDPAVIKEAVEVARLKATHSDTTRLYATFTFTGLLATGIAAYGIYTQTGPILSTTPKVSWPAYEFTTLGVAWTYTLTTIMVTLALIYTTYRRVNEETYKFSANASEDSTPAQLEKGMHQ